MRAIATWIPGLIVTFSLLGCGGSAGTPPRVEFQNPAPAESAVKVPTHETLFEVQIGFDSPMDPDSFGPGAVTLSYENPLPTEEGEDKTIYVSGEVIVEGAAVSYFADGDIPFDTEFTVRVTTAVADTAGDHLEDNVVWMFTTEPPPE